MSEKEIRELEEYVDTFKSVQQYGDFRIEWSDQQQFSDQLREERRWMD